MNIRVPQMMKLNSKKILTALSKFSFKTVYFNFKYLPLRDALKLPIWVSKNCLVRKAKGNIIIKGKVVTGMIQIGYGNVGIFDKKYSRTIIQHSGTMVFAGKVFIGHGCKLAVGKGAVLKIGDRTSISAETEIICQKGITIGNNSLLSWDILLMDTDQHSIMNKEGEIINPSQKITIGDKVWIGCRSVIMKGVSIPSGNVIAANTTVTKSLTATNSIIGGFPNKVLKDEILWGDQKQH